MERYTKTDNKVWVDTDPLLMGELRGCECEYCGGINYPKRTGPDGGYICQHCDRATN